MEENTNTNLNTNNNNINTVASITSTHKFSKKKLVLIILIIILVGLGIGYYFYMKKTVAPYIPTLEEKTKAVEETVNKTKEIGLPTVKQQVDIMNYNLQN